MNRAPSRPAAASRRPQPKANPNHKPKILSPRSPLKDLNAGTFKSRSSSCTSSTTATATSAEPPSNCFRLRLSNSSSSSSNCTTNPQNHHRRHRLDCDYRNPRNPPTTTKHRLKSSKPLDKGRNLGDRISTDSASERVPKVNRLRQCRTVSQKKVVSAGRNDLWSRSERLEEATGESGKGFEFTPVGCKTGPLECGFDKVALGSDCDKNGNGNTPPAEATVSPEIQCGSNVMSAATPVCFGAGHVLSGVSDKRRCRPRGVLVVGDNCKGIDGLGVSNEELDGIGNFEAGCGLAPLLPAEASMHWLLSPCDEDVDRNGECELLPYVNLYSSLSGSSGYETSSNDSKDKNAGILSSVSALTITGVGSSPLVSPSKSLFIQCLLESPPDCMASSSLHSPPWTTPNNAGGVSCLDEMIYPNRAGQNSLCFKDTLGSENVIRTPEADSSLERHTSLPWFHADEGKHAVESYLDCAVDGQQRTSFSSEGQIVAFEPTDSSFEFDCHLKPARSTEFSQLLYNWDKSSCISDAILENERRSQFRISFRDGLSSHLTEIDDSDCCRCLSDEEDKNHQYSSDPVGPETKLPDMNTVSFIKKSNVKSTGCMKRNENSTLQKNIQLAESISLDGGSLAASGDSGWDMCYKNNLFQVE